MEDLKATHKLGVAETLKAYELFHCFIIHEAQTQWAKIVQEIHCKDPWIGVNGQLHKGLPVQPWLSFQDCIKPHKLTVLPTDAAENQHFYMQQTVKKPQRVTVHLAWVS